MPKNKKNKKKHTSKRKNPPLSPPKSTEETKTGSWRAKRPIIDREKCKKCGKCWLTCPEGAIKKTKEGFKVNLEHCKGCGICAEECPFKVIKMEVEVK